ncbi:hypothetical protein RJ639_009853 [Escallonia herrerae]|uniref:Integrase catalytic domain-containing protein n=1 Tax=Escallonia herrerae TaxID=1293975 RepID=A0AA88VRK8_9ASTE|nr:hypothetical protein RJ639_009853 [Escallonia herrerae]
MKRVLIDNEGSAEVLFYDAFKRMNILTDRLQNMDTSLYGFSNNPIAIEGVIALPIAIGTPSTQANLMLHFVVVRVHFAYNAILGQPALNQLQAVVSTYHLKMKFSTEHGIGEIKGDQTVARQCYVASCRSKNKEALIIEDLWQDAKMQRGEPVEDLMSIEVYPGEKDKIVRIGSNLEEDIKLEQASNNEAEYEVLLAGLRLAHALKKILRQGYYWPAMQNDAITFTRRCDKCQKFAPVPHTLVTPLTSVVSPIPFAIWGMDLMVPFSLAFGQQRFVIVAIDYFTKWIEAEALATITSAKCENFFWKKVVCRFRIPKALVVDNKK